MPRRRDQYGESLIGPPTYTEWLSKEIGELLLSKGAHVGDATSLTVESNGVKAWVRDYWNFGHKGEDSSISNIERRNAMFYEDGHTPILSIDIDGAHTEHRFTLFRPIDVIKGGWVDNVLTNGFTDTEKDIFGVVSNLKVDKYSNIPIRSPEKQPSLYLLQSILLP